VLANDVTIEGRDQYVRLLRRRVDRDRILAGEEIAVSDRLALHVREECLATLAGRERFDVVRTHAMQERSPVVAANLDLRPTG
jgi:hypothetical protein